MNFAMGRVGLIEYYFFFKVLLWRGGKEKGSRDRFGFHILQFRRSLSRVFVLFRRRHAHETFLYECECECECEYEARKQSLNDFIFP